MAEEKDTTKKSEEKVEEKAPKAEAPVEEKVEAKAEAKEKKEEISKEEVAKDVLSENEENDILSSTGELKLEVKPKKKGSDGKISTPKNKGKKKKVRRQVQKGCAYIRSSYNNTVVSLTDMHGGMLAWSSSGLLGFKGAKKATTYAATQVVLDADEKVQKYGLRDIDVYIKGVGGGREAALRALAQKGYNITKIKDVTPIPHN
jgi:small subunit ribosomal protein S11